MNPANKIKNICFYNHWHYGDLLITKEFIRYTISLFPNINFSYLHTKNNKVLLDLERCTFSKPPIFLESKMANRFIEAGDTLYINTWIRAYSNKRDEFVSQEGNRSDSIEFRSIDFSTESNNWKSYFRIWSYILQVINLYCETNHILIGSPIDYAHRINPLIFHESKLLKGWRSQTDLNKSVLINNNLVLSGHTHINDDMTNIINELSLSYPYLNFICTKKASVDKANILFTDNLIPNSRGCDLNEIALLSKFVPLIAGRNSGPFNFANLHENIFDSNKRFLAFGSDYLHSMPAHLETNCSWEWVEDFSNEIMLEAINKNISISFGIDKV